MKNSKKLELARKMKNQGGIGAASGQTMRDMGGNKGGPTSPDNIPSSIPWESASRRRK